MGGEQDLAEEEQQREDQAQHRTDEQHGNDAGELEFDEEREKQRHDHAADDQRTRHELKRLQRRATFINWSLGLCTSCALLVCSMIVTLFLALFIELDLTRIVAVLFIGAMLCLIAALLFFFGEILLATHKMKIAP